jgi:hypothetical protein
VTSRLEDPEQELQFTEGTLLAVRGGEAALKVSDDAIYMAVSVRNVGTGLAVLLGWHVQVGVQLARSHPPLDEFAGQRRDIYVPTGDVEGGQRVISQFILRHQGERCLVSAGRHFQIDQPDPREGE